MNEIYINIIDHCNTGCLVVVMIMYGGCGHCTCNSYATHYADCQVVVAVVLYIKLVA